MPWNYGGAQPPKHATLHAKRLGHKTAKITLNHLVIEEPAIALLPAVISPLELAFILTDADIKRRNLALKKLLENAQRKYLDRAIQQFSQDIKQMKRDRGDWQRYKPLLIQAASNYFKNHKVLRYEIKSILQKVRPPRRTSDKTGALAVLAAIGTLLTIPFSGPFVAALSLGATGLGIADAFVKLNEAENEQKTRVLLDKLDRFDALFDIADAPNSTDALKAAAVIEILLSVPELKTLGALRKAISARKASEALLDLPTAIPKDTAQKTLPGADSAQLGQKILLLRQQVISKVAALN